MRVHALISILVLLLTLCNGEVFGSKLEGRELGLADIPPCGIQCLFLTIPASGCSLDDLNCQCNNEGFAQAVGACMLANCTMADNLGTARVQAVLCDLPQESKRMEIFLYTGIVYSIATFFVVLRITGKIVSKRLSWDDCIVVAALLLTAIPVGCVVAMTKIGFGEHLWDLEDGTLLPILRYFYISWSTYVIVLGMIKASIVLFYLEIFKTRRFEIAAYIILAYIVVSSLVIYFLTAFACSPVSSFWNRDIKGKCMDIQILAYANSASAILQDVILLILPLVFIRKLQVKRYRKIAVGFMFAVGTFGCIATIVRLRTLLAFTISLDPTWDYVPVTIWTELELAACFVCVSLPSIRILLVRILPASVKEFLSHITRQSRSRSNPTPKPGTPAREWKKPASWINITLEANDSGHGSGGGKSFNSLWSRNSNTPSTHRHMRQGSSRLESAMGHYDNASVAVTRPPYLERQRDEIELLEVPKGSKSARQSLKSHNSRDSHITALPTIGRIGCLPEGSYSDLDLSRDFRGLDRKRSRQ
ncbi:hypothetical protein CC86DRAFT_359936 [Ophiobolus disseminans]|uniref:CFEM domain-containing protein n=1 Tax=Ophiobolus disseminans TaxID=1469910 RepID=A0A6A6ZJK1_9PLEO|nr:hypothetical protein CC86DRAFT_359936 [Ophiobolus disseminans]